MQIGDKVKFVNETLEGTVTRLIDGKTIGVSIEEGFEIPVLRNEVLLISSSVAVENHDKKEIPVHAAVKNAGSEISVLFEQSSPTWYRASLLNLSGHSILLSVTCKIGSKYKALFGGRVEKGTSYLFNNLNIEELEQWGTYCFRIIFHEMESELPRPPWYLEYTFKSKDFMNPKEMDGKPTYVIPLKPYKIEQFTLGSEPIKIGQAPLQDATKITRPEEVADIHIHHLLENYKEITAEEALELQMKHFNNLFEKAVALNYNKITIIHGVGNGTLKQKIWKAISGHKSVKTFSEARKEKFGYGATEIIFN